MSIQITLLAALTQVISPVHFTDCVPLSMASFLSHLISASGPQADVGILVTVFAL